MKNMACNFVMKNNYSTINAGTFLSFKLMTIIIDVSKDHLSMLK